MQKTVYFIVGAIVIIGIIVGGWLKFGEDLFGPAAPTANVHISNLAKNAFGILDPSQRVERSSAGDQKTLTADSALLPGSSSSSGSGSTLIAPVPSDVINYEYIYKGDPLVFPNLTVLKRQKGFANQELTNLIRSNLGFIDLTTFKNVRVDYLTVSEEIGDGYALSIDFHDGSLSITQNVVNGYDGIKPLPARGIEPGAQIQAPPDSELLDIAARFLQEHRINFSLYGAPEVRNDYIVQAQLFAQEGQADVSSLYPYGAQSMVVYPLVISNQKVFDEGGNTFGLTVNIDVSTKKVVAVYNIMSLGFESSPYELETDPEKILAVVKRGGIYGSGPIDGATKTVQIEVGTPTIGYMLSRYQLDGGANDILVPAFIFPISKVPQGQELYTKAIVVPIVKDLLSPFQGGGGVEVKTLPADSVR